MSISSPCFTEPCFTEPRAIRSTRSSRSRFDSVGAAKVLSARCTALFVFEQLGLPRPNIDGVRSGAILVARVADDAIEHRLLDDHDLASLRELPTAEALERLVQLLARALGRSD
ncbi:MAG: hypothetical protein KC503_35390 [Myxococcales bacterium]|nr:hypothetical protein [Myxococcales bacterium]